MDSILQFEYFLPILFFIIHPISIIWCLHIYYAKNQYPSFVNLIYFLILLFFHLTQVLQSHIWLIPNVPIPQVHDSFIFITIIDYLGLLESTVRKCDPIILNIFISNVLSIWLIMCFPLRVI